MMGISQAQQAVIECLDSSCLVVAGAGSGKTRTIIEKLLHLVRSGYSPERILAITFTNKAASEMKGRLETQANIPVERFRWVRTFHSACFMILKNHLDFLGYSYLQIYDERKKEALLKSLVGDKEGVGIAAGMISAAKNTGNPIRYFADKNPLIGNRFLFDIYKDYNSALRQRNALDFDDLLLSTYELLSQSESARSYYRQLFQYIFVDEWQDTNTVQAEIIRLLVNNGNLTVVGDDRQSIYAFRGSNLENFFNFDGLFPKSKTFKLEQNYRSAAAVVNLSDKLILNNASQTKKVCFSEIPGGDIFFHQYSDERDEAAEVANEINQIVSDGLSYSDIAILYRANYLSLNFEKALRSAKIPYQIVGGKGFFERKEILDLLAYLTILIYPKDDEAFLRLLSCPRRGIGDKTVEKIKMSGGDGSLYDAARKVVSEKKINGNIYKELSKLFNVLDSLDIVKDTDSLLSEIVEKIGYEKYLNDFCKGDKDELIQRLGNVSELISIASGRSLTEFIEDISLFTDAETDNAEDKNKVSLMTVHKSKGTEYTAVFIVGCEDGLFPHHKMDEIEEERRLFYVGMTRAKQRLSLSCAAFRFGEMKKISRFLYEIF